MENNDSLSSQAARKFAEKYKDATSEKRLAHSFWTDFFQSVIGIGDLLAVGIEFEYPVRSSEGRINFIDCLWPGVLLVEHKSAGKDLNLAEKQARDYVIGLPPVQRPPVIIVSDFKRIRIIELLAGNTFEFAVTELPDNVHRFTSIIGKQVESATRAETNVDQEAVDLMAKLFNEFDKAGYGGHEVSVFLVRILFLNFGDDTRMWKRKGSGLFSEFAKATSPDGMGVGGRIQELFQTLDTPIENRPGTLAASLVDFPYVNGGLFKELLPIFAFTPAMREALIVTTEYDWSKISPAIFGAMFQTVKSKVDRRSLGEHYTSEENILKVIRPLFLDSYLARLSKAWESPNLLKSLKADLAKNNYLDPACGSGNFLVVAYKRLREIELKIDARLQELEGKQGQVYLDGQLGLSVHLGQFAGIEINEWSSQIATVAMFLADHQANLAMEEVVGTSPNRFPLKESANIVHANALDVDWSKVTKFDENTYVMGNPPFYGARFQDAEQKADTERVWGKIKGSGDLDFVTNWFLLAAKHIAKTGGHAGLVATNSITQGEQPPIIWSQLSPLGIGIDFAHRTFSWSNEAKGKAVVHCVIVGFSAVPKQGKRQVWSYKTPKSNPVLHEAENLNAYLLDAPNVLVTNRSKPLVEGIPLLKYGSQPNDGGFISNLSEEEANEIREKDPIAAKYLRLIVGGRELLHNEARYCLWLGDASPLDVRSSPVLSSRVAEVKKAREESSRVATQVLAKTPTLFGFINQPSTDYIAVPLITSSERDYLPIAHLTKDVISNNKIGVIPSGDFYIFGWLSSRVFTVWNKAISGRLKNDLNVGITTTYNNFPFPITDPGTQAKIRETAEGVVKARSQFPESSLAHLYDSVAMPPALRKAHDLLDKECLAAIGLKASASDEDVLAYLLKTYESLSMGVLSGAN